jgi:photoactive yellow protein
VTGHAPPPGGDRTLPDLDRMSEGELDALPYGVIRLDRDGIVRFFNRAESRESGHPPRAVLGKHFFDAVAPCANLPAYRDRVEDVMRRAGRVDTFQYIYRLPGMDPRRVTVTTFASAGGGAWIVAR